MTADFVDIGLQIFHPLQPEAMDIRRMKRQFGRHLTFRGGIGTHGAVTSGTPDQAPAELRRAAGPHAAARRAEPSAGFSPSPSFSPVARTTNRPSAESPVRHYRFTCP